MVEAYITSNRAAIRQFFHEYVSARVNELISLELVIKLDDDTWFLREPNSPTVYIGGKILGNAYIAQFINKKWRKEFIFREVGDLPDVL